MGPLRRKRKRTYNEPGHAHYLTFSCHKRLALLNRDTTRRWVVEAIDRARHKHAMSFWAYVIMPEHVHLLIHPRREPYSIQKFLFSCKRSVSWKAKRWLMDRNETAWLRRLTVARGGKPTFRFWMPGGGYDENIVKLEAVREVVDYIHGNPVRRGLVEKPEDWHWSSAAFWAGRRDVPLTMDPMDL